MAPKLKGEGGKALVAGKLKKKIFCGFPKELNFYMNRHKRLFHFNTRNSSQLALLE